MARSNEVKLKGIVKDDIYYDTIERNGKTIQFLRFLLNLPGSKEAKEVKGMRVLAYGTLAEYIEAHIQPGSYVQIVGHIQIRSTQKGLAVEAVVEDIDFIQRIDWERGRRKYSELQAIGMIPPYISAPVYYIPEYVGPQPEFAFAMD